MDLYQELCGILGEENVFTKEPMSRHTTFRAGGPADFFVTPEKEGQVRKTLSLLKEAQVPRYIMGNGSNLLVGDRGYRGVILQICKKMNRIRIQDTVIQAQAGALLSKIAAEAQAKGLTGFEFASGIPGSLGGAVMMNAGAYGGEMKQVLIQAQILNASGEIEDVLAEEMELGYRSSVFSRNGGVILSASIQLEPGDPSAIQSRMEELKFLRTSKQPLEYPSAGSTFKRPEGYFAGKLIQDAGLRGFQVGGAQVSEKHCGFVINKDQASAMDIRSLMEQVSEKVYTRFGVRLEPEVKLIGEF
ncbi:MAG: UDP-N-acetylmuramate dehydrogenase [Ruminococcus sp.]|jgi:UDP-N-acetylmuramate dehydrogenase|nr:UDP-N-acetylmuramate dehydrogenase [uncultured Schaedlerella sp.]MCI8768665.1 UDP-N-acetylmuramate dehydrogenase [Ruminococcus sp.]MCI9329801.1 UDP-N-acetylmuramate dehydrogenase [Ruminococcus sp.]